MQRVLNNLNNPEVGNKLFNFLTHTGKIVCVAAAIGAGVGIVSGTGAVLGAALAGAGMAGAIIGRETSTLMGTATESVIDVASALKFGTLGSILGGTAITAGTSMTGLAVAGGAGSVTEAALMVASATGIGAIVEVGGRALGRIAGRAVEARAGGIARRMRAGAERVQERVDGNIGAVVGIAAEAAAETAETRAGAITEYVINKFPATTLALSGAQAILENRDPVTKGIGTVFLSSAVATELTRKRYDSRHFNELGTALEIADLPHTAAVQHRRAAAANQAAGR
jgi:hypothetical protein